MSGRWIEGGGRKERGQVRKVGRRRAMSQPLLLPARLLAFTSDPSIVARDYEQDEITYIIDLLGGAEPGMTKALASCIQHEYPNY